MKRFLFLGVGSALVFTMSGVGTAQADNGPHVSTAALPNTTVTLGVNPGDNVGGTRCASCHRAHTSQGEYNLKQAQPDLCFSCHGNGAPGSTTDVVNGIGTAAPTAGALRGGGFSYALMNAAGPTKTLGALDPATGRIATSNQTIGLLSSKLPTTSSHNITGTAGTAWGNGAVSAKAVTGKALTLECGSCHDPHGNGNYRILRPIPVDSGSVSPVVVPGVAAVLNDNGTVKTPAVAPVTNALGVKIPDATTKVYTTTNYWLAGDSYVPPVVNGVNVGTAVPDGYIGNIAQWCTTCHTRYLAGSGSYKTDSGDAIFKYRHRSDANNKLGAANCITCHVSHGTNAAMTGIAGDGTVPGVTLPGGASAPTGDSRLLRVDNRGTCLMCHNV